MTETTVNFAAALRRCCADPRNDARTALCKPFNVGDYVAATDGMQILWVRRDFVPDLEVVEDERAPAKSVASYIQAAAGGDYRPLDPVFCAVCSAKGEQSQREWIAHDEAMTAWQESSAAKCSTCNGNGDVWCGDCRAYHVCQCCDGDGMKDRESMPPEPEIHTDALPEFDNLRINLRFARALGMIGPGVEAKADLLKARTNVGGETNVLFFRAADGACGGIVMPIRQGEGDHD